MAFSKSQRILIHDKFNGCCAYCGEPIKLNDMQVDHVVPQRDFYYLITKKHNIPKFLDHLEPQDCNHLDNLFPACRVCNKWKNTFHVELFRSEIEEQIKRLNKTSSNFRMAKKYGLVQETIKPITFHFERFLNGL